MLLLFLISQFGCQTENSAEAMERFVDGIFLACFLVKVEHKTVELSFLQNIYVSQ